MKATDVQVAKYEEERKAMEVRLRESRYSNTLKEKIAIVIDSWDNLGAPDERRAIKRYMNDVEFNRKVQSMYAVVENNERNN